MEYQPQSEEEYTQQLDRLADTYGSYDEARKRLGPPPYDLYYTSPDGKSGPTIGVSVVHGTVRHHHGGDGPQYGEEEVNYVDELPHYYQRYAGSPSDKQAEINRRGADQARQALQGSPVPDDEQE
jgi:hypothetical protein